MVVINISDLLSRVSSVFTQMSFKNHYLALARDGFIEEQAAAVLLVQAWVLGPCGAASHAAQAGHSEGLEAVSGERRGRRRGVGLVTGGGPAPVAARGAVAGRGEGASRTVVLPGATQTLCEQSGEREGTEKEINHVLRRYNHNKTFGCSSISDAR